MTAYLRCTLASLWLLAVAGCSGLGPDSERSLFVSAAEADAFHDSKLRALSDEQDVVDGLLVFFDTDSSAIDPRYRGRLAYVANYLVAHPQAQVFVEGHTDDVGSPEQNLVLAQARADMIAYYLVKYGALYEQVNKRSYGELFPAYQGDSEDVLKYNRRGVVEWASHDPTLDEY